MIDHEPFPSQREKQASLRFHLINISHFCKRSIWRDLPFQYPETPCIFADHLGWLTRGHAPIVIHSRLARSERGRSELAEAPQRPLGSQGRNLGRRKATEAMRCGVCWVN